MLPLCARGPVCVRPAAAHSSSIQTITWPLSMKQSTIGKFFGKPAVAQTGAKPLAPSNAARQVTAQAKEVRTPEKKRIRDDVVRILQSKVNIYCLQGPLSSPAARSDRQTSCIAYTECDAAIS